LTFLHGDLIAFGQGKCLPMRPFGPFTGVVLCALALAGCAIIHNEPINQPLAYVAAPPPPNPDVPKDEDDLLIALSFSGGGTRAAAFSHGVLGEMGASQVRTRGGRVTSVLDHIDFVSGVSGGSVTAAYFGLRGRSALNDFRERFLLQNAEESLSTRISLVNLSRALAGGVNDSRAFPRWLDDNLFNGATFAQLPPDRAPRTLINASDIYNRTPFLFGQTAFSVMCSDINSYPIAEAVAASAAVPVVFAPVVIRTYPGQCKQPLPDWIERARRDNAASPMLKSYANAIARYHDGSMPYIKLLDGGLVDNFGLSGFTIALLSSNTPYGPLSPRQAVRLRRVLALVVDAGRGPSGNWTQTIEGPTGPELVVAAADTAMVASVRASYTAFDRTMAEWQSGITRWRCGLSEGERARLGVGSGWNCRDLKVYVTRVAFDQLGPERAAVLDAVPTSFRLPAQSVDAVIAAGREALRSNPTYRSFLTSL
jgi:NTE family protein